MLPGVSRHPAAAAALATLRAAVQRHQPRFVLYFSAPPGSDYQATMWLPHLRRLGEPFLVVLAKPHHLPTVARGHRRPGGGVRDIRAADDVSPVPPGHRA